jgi:HSP20 family protein
MSAVALHRRDATQGTTVRYRDPFALARELFNWEPFQRSAFSPTFEVKETDLDISVHSGVLSVSGSRSAEERKEGESYYLYERQYGSFSRSFSLPETADGEKIEAKLDNGVLSLTIGKRVEAKPRKIALKK